MTMESDYDKLLALIYSGDDTNLRLALQMGRATGIDLQPVYRQLQECVAFFEGEWKEAMSIPKLINEVKEKGIDLDCSNLSELPTCLKVLAPITTYMSLYGNNFHVFPEVLLHFRQLEHLNLSDNRLTKLPEGLWDLQKLKCLLLEENLILHISPRIERLSNLETFGFSYRDSLKLPESMLYLTKLTMLTVSFDGGKDFPEMICNFKGLKELFIYGKYLTQISENIRQLQALETLTISDSPITHIPDSLAEVQHIKKLYLEELSELKIIPPFVFELKNLEELRLRNTPLYEMSPLIRHLQGLKRLDLRGTTIFRKTQEQWGKRLSVWLPDTQINWG